MWSKEKVRVTSWTLVGSMWECLCGHQRPTPRHSNGQKHKWHWKPLKAKTKVGIHSKWTILVGLCRIYGYANFSEQWGRELKYLFWSASWRTLLFPFEKNVCGHLLICFLWGPVSIRWKEYQRILLQRPIITVDRQHGNRYKSCVDIFQLWIWCPRHTRNLCNFFFIFSVKNLFGRGLLESLKAILSNICEVQNSIFFRAALSGANICKIFSTIFIIK